MYVAGCIYILCHWCKSSVLVSALLSLFPLLYILEQWKRERKLRPIIICMVVETLASWQLSWEATSGLGGHNHENNDENVPKFQKILMFLISIEFPGEI